MNSTASIVQRLLEEAVSATFSPLLLDMPPSTTAAALSASSMALNISTRTASPQGNLFEYMRNLYIWLVPSMIVILTLAILGNGLIVVSSPWLSRPVSPYLKLCISLAAADLWAASLLITGLVVNSYIPVVIVGRPPVSKCPEAALEIFRISGMLTSDLHLFALAVNQFVGIAWPLKCYFNFYLRFPFRLTIFLIFMLPLLATLALYVFILLHLFKAKARFDAAPPSVSNGNTSGRRNAMTATSRKNQVQSKLKLVWTTLLIVSTFSFSWGLCVFLFVLVCVDGCLVSPKSVGIYRMVAMGSSVNCLVMVKLALNPFIYTLRIRHIRASVQGFTYWVCRRRQKGASPQGTLTDYHALSTAPTPMDSEADDWLRRVVSLNPLRRNRTPSQATCYASRKNTQVRYLVDAVPPTAGPTESGETTEQQLESELRALRAPECSPLLP